MASEGVRAVDRALGILLCFSQSEPALSLTQIAHRLEMPKSTAHRLLGTLESKRFVARDATTGLYRLGYRFIEMASLVLQQVDLLQWVQPYLQRLSDECSETVDLAVMDGAQVTYLQVVESSQRVKIAAAVGQRLPAHCTASGKAFMAFLPDERVKGILGAGLSRYTERTNVALPDLLDDLRQTRERGFAMSAGEYETDIHAVAAPILDAMGYPLAVIAVVGPSYRMPRERMLTLGRLTQAAIETMRREIGAASLTMLLSTTKPS
jgi:DNA-binding IclR family transcriptional regulator